MVFVIQSTIVAVGFQGLRASRIFADQRTHSLRSGNNRNRIDVYGRHG